MKILVCGSRNILNYGQVVQAVETSGFLEELGSATLDTIPEIISGGARGVDALAERYARANKFDLTVFHANWEGRGKSAGYDRNRRMLEYCDVVIAVWDGQSFGTKNTIKQADNMDKPLWVHRVPITMWKEG